MKLLSYLLKGFSIVFAIDIERILSIHVCMVLLVKNDRQPLRPHKQVTHQLMLDFEKTQK